MAGRIKRPCAAPGCSALVVKGYCDRCKDKAPARQAERARPNAWSRLYTRAWQKMSAARLIKHPLCVDPYGLHAGVPEPATVTDHIVAHKGDRKLFWDSKNWQSLCRPCNSRKAALEEGGFGNRVVIDCVFEVVPPRMLSAAAKG